VNHEDHEDREEAVWIRGFGRRSPNAGRDLRGLRVFVVDSLNPSEA
jgi:hypothetical protein